MFNQSKAYAQRFRRWLRAAGKDVWKVGIENEQIQIYKNNLPESCIPLLSITSIQALKRDMLTWDEIYLDLESKDKHHLISERYEGFGQLVQFLASSFALNPSDWQQELNRSGAFENRTIELWKKD